MSNPLLTLTDISKEFPQTHAPLSVLSSISLTVNEGETVAICGPSGSGKSTLLNIAGGLDTPTTGTVTFAGKDFAEMDDQQLSELRLKEIGFIFQQHHLFPQCTALENILMPTLPLGKNKSNNEYALELLNAVGLADRVNHFPSMLSGGECQRVALARALINRPKLIFADEPTGSLDNVSAEAMTELLLKLNTTYNTTLIVVTHSDSVASTMQRTLNLHNGRLNK